MKKVQRLIPVFFHPWCYSENFSAFQHHPVSHTYDFHLHSLLQFLTETVEWEWLDLNRWPGFSRKCYFSRLKSEFLKYVLWMCLKLNVKGHLWWGKKSFLFICFQSIRVAADDHSSRAFLNFVHFPLWVWWGIAIHFTGSYVTVVT